MRRWSTFPEVIGLETCAGHGGLLAPGATTVATISMSQKSAFFMGKFAAPFSPQIKVTRHIAYHIYGFWITCGSHGSGGLVICPAH